jgi:sulfur carrier protein
MQIKVNGKDVKLENEISVRELLDVEQVQTPEYVTVQLNGEFVERDDFGKTVVKHGDVVEFLYFMGGGVR